MSNTIPHPVLDLRLFSDHKKTVKITMVCNNGYFTYANENGELKQVEAGEKVTDEVYGGLVSASGRSVYHFKGDPITFTTNSWIFPKGGTIESSSIE